jgi:hypothetical protein
VPIRVENTKHSSFLSLAAQIKVSIWPLFGAEVKLDIPEPSRGTK